MRRIDARPALVLLAFLILAGLAILACSKKETPEATKETPQHKLAIPAGLEQDYARFVPADNPLTAEKIELGKMLYFDPRLSVDGTVSCATCHNPIFGYSNGVQFSPGFKGQLGNRNSPTTLNRLYSTVQFWDGRSNSLEDQALGPVQNPVEMANTVPGMIANLNKISGYKPYFQKAFGSEEITADRVARAIAAFERTLLTGNSPFDRFQAGDPNAISDSAKQGFTIFMGKGNCHECHPLPAFTDEKFHNVGVGMDKPKPDLGRYTVTKNEEDKGAFKTPTLRQIAETAPYLHDGSATTIEEVVDLYNRGSIKNPHLDEKMKPLGLNKAERADLVAFLKTLTGEAPMIEQPALPE
jgi:cytochrome c peroxidase